jgi:amino-acid N-acetyltransferase
LNLALEACKKGLERVHLIDQRIDGVILNELFSELGSGLMIYDDNYGAIRPMDLEDVADVLSLMRPFVKKGILLERSEAQLKELHGDFVVYEIDGAIRACAALHVYGEEQGEIAAVVVDERYNKAGIGIKLIDFLKKKARSLGIASLFVLTTQTADWFEKQGFKPDILESIPLAKQEKIDKNRKSKVFRLELV